MDARLIRTFVIAARSRTFSAAANELKITQPALTKQIQALERRAGTPLFVRGRRGAQLTNSGRALLREAIELDHRVQDFDRRLQLLAAGLEGHLSLGFGLSSIDLAPRLVAEFRRRYPDVAVALDDLPSTVQVERVRSGSLNGAFIRLPAPSDLESVVLTSDRLAIACAPNDLPPTADEASLAAWLPERPLVRLRATRGPGLAAQIEAFLKDLDCRPTVTQQADDLQTVLALVAGDLGSAIVPATASRIAPSAVQFIEIKSSLARWEVGIVWNSRAMSGPLRNLLDLLH
jgi:DNA-binding transcriptional LysR family regulator